MTYIYLYKKETTLEILLKFLQIMLSASAESLHISGIPKNSVKSH